MGTQPRDTISYTMQWESSKEQHTKKQHNTKCIYFDFSSRDSIGFETTYIYILCHSVEEEGKPDLNEKAELFFSLSGYLQMPYDQWC